MLDAVPGTVDVADVADLEFFQFHPTVLEGKTDAAGVAALLKPLSVRYASDPELWQRVARQYADHDRLRYHQALGNAYYLQNKPSAALEQYQLASQAPGDDFYVRSSIEARIRELQTQLDEARKENGGKPLPRERWRDGLAYDHAPLSRHAH